ncbi:DoxX family protein [Microbispora sp. H13382]|uniref:DoxX family protein n=1 Tax=Microbispora sp. H13382 TaxID=2729112 RepID=UPI0015FFFE46|nr:DoxX family protein [Microbispora sp. H13382]
MIHKFRPVALLLARVAVGVIFIAYGWQKLFVNGVAGTTQFFESIGAPIPAVTAPLVGLLEAVGGAALVLGALLPVAGTLLALNMIGAIILVHGANGLYVDKGGYEFVLALAAAALAIGFTGGGMLAVDDLWKRRGSEKLAATAH